jgi:hypothetical protein
MKAVKIIHPGKLEREGRINILQRLPAVPVKIPERMIQIEEKVPIAHPAIYCLFNQPKTGGQGVNCIS